MDTSTNLLNLDPQWQFEVVDGKGLDDHGASVWPDCPQAILRVIGAKYPLRLTLDFSRGNNTKWENQCKALPGFSQKKTFGPIFGPFDKKFSSLKELFKTGVGRAVKFGVQPMMEWETS